MEVGEIPQATEMFLIEVGAAAHGSFESCRKGTITTGKRGVRESPKARETRRLVSENLC